ncbi:restriction endonuclease subunit S [Vibrio parahaemolyticus]|uniref:restriction endonuclease subunit S n=1 Tax=Vibrio parahaemolyticus TaxID=670 RepID=UPI0004037020|nr:restriction endonuclease subunit S [Vibrio parahaemolyticus]KIT49473.1 hypothetical protein H337_03895 [Vibrio parahaemolyticus EN9701121]EJG2252962.1 restriction endonuclease subunit S [Vibrio parahaemolyticus]KKX89268.1 hypothetical protein UF37_04625 [Vibrio parahaemolyticus]KYY26124.1 hypothetical protein AWQ06_03450 [Vibrio parahaemolyticus]KYY27857.1 hypothetical protein AWQ07_07075 [Vibrio parahaemolyticus]
MELNGLNQAAPEGFIQTEFGVIPELWNVISIDEALCKGWLLDQMDGNHGELYPKSHEFSSYGIPYVGATDFSSGNINYRKCKYLPEKRARKFKKGIAKTGDILFAHNATVGPVAIVGAEHDFIIISTTATYYRCNEEKINKDYLAAFFRSQLFSSQYCSVMSQSTRNQVPILAQRKFYLVLPQLEEQTAIANALSDVDFLISELEKLIAKKQAIKTATMQQLLTGKKRLPQFAKNEDGTLKGYKKTELGEIPEDWDICILNDVINSLSSGATPYRGNKDFYKGKNLWITSGELKYGVINDTFEKISDEALKKSNLKIHPQGTFLMAITGLEVAGTRGSCGIVGRPAATNQSCMAIYPNEKLTSNYLFHWYTYNGDELALKYCQGTKQLSYTAGLLKTIPIFLPHDTCEQIAISNILSDMDLEVLKLKSRLNKTRQIKQGMMQELLTGKTRLVKPESK